MIIVIKYAGFVKRGIKVQKERYYNEGKCLLESMPLFL